MFAGRRAINFGVAQPCQLHGRQTHPRQPQNQTCSAACSPHRYNMR
jgi:hypothetical protein